MAINKVVYGNQTLMDLTADTVTASDVASGVTFHNAAGEAAVGTASGSSDVVDVEVNGVSVVNADKVAQITSYKEVTQAEYEALPDTKLTDDIAYFIKDIDNPAVEGYPPLIYSNEEREVGVWCDGKPLYQKTINFGSLPNNGAKSVAHNISNIENVVLIGGYAIRTSDTDCVPLPYAAPTAQNSIQCTCGVTNVNVRTGVDRTDRVGYITIQYTKTTDTAGSGTWNGQGGLAHHYSTNETAIGTWIDGKPLYEKTIEITNPTHGAWTQIISDNSINIIGYINEASYSLTQAGEKSSIDFCVNSNLYGRSLISNNGHSMQIEYYNPYGTLSKYIVTIQYTKITD